jgi:hypothetical protein
VTRPRSRIVSAALGALLLAGCGAGRDGASTAPPDASSSLRPIRAGTGPAFRLAPRGARAARAAAINGMRCVRRDGERVQAHLELFAAGRVVPIPPGIGVAPPLRRSGAYVDHGRCTYPARTTEPTGLLELRRGAGLTLGQLFDVWGQPLSRTRMASFAATPARPVRAYVDGVRWTANPRAIPLRAHAVIVLEVGPYVPPHANYRFPDQAAPARSKHQLAPNSSARAREPAPADATRERAGNSSQDPQSDRANQLVFMAGAGFEQTSATVPRAYRIVEIRRLV